MPWTHKPAIKTVIDRSFSNCRQWRSFQTSHCDVTAVELWRHANKRYLYCDVKYADCSYTRKLTQNWSSLLNNNREYRFPGNRSDVSLTFRELSKIFSRNLYITKIVRVSKAMLWAHVQGFSLNSQHEYYIWHLYIFARSFWKARETLVKHPPSPFSWRSVNERYILI